MEKEKYKHNPNRFICSVCLNRNESKEDTTLQYKECFRRKSRSCPICQKNYNHNIENTEILKDKETVLVKNVQTSQSDVNKGLSLLNEVLTEFQNKKQSVTKRDRNKTIILKDASVNTEKNVPKLSISKVFYYTIDEISMNNSCKCAVINCQPEMKTSAALVKHKSSSIPQMKLDELKNSLKQKTTSKDAIEEVNRMFANVKKIDKAENNLPLIRNGPRVLPVVKTGKVCDNNEDVATLKCNCQNYKMSSGDSKCCHCANDECFHTCCHYQKRVNVEFCGNCRKKFVQ